MTDYLGGPGPVDEISQDRGFSLPGRSHVPSSVTPGAKLTALTTALAVVLAGGVVTAAWRSLQSHDAPERLVPATAFAVGTLDLSLRGHDDTLSTFANHFPGSPTHKGDGSAVDRLLRAIFRGSSDPHVDYDDDIKPWLGNRVAIAGWIDKSGKPQMEGLVESTDDTAAREELTRLFKDGDGAFDFADGFAVLGDTHTLVKESIDAAHHASLADSDTYSADIDALPGDPAMTGWLDGPGARKALEASFAPEDARTFESMGSLGPFGMLGPLGILGAAGAGGVGGGAAAGLPTTSAMFAGRTSLGVRVDDRYLEIDSRATSAHAQHQATTDELRALPDSTIATLELGDPSALVTGVTSMLKGFFALPTQLSMQTCATPLGGPVPPARSENYGHCDTFTPPPPPDPLKQIERATGLQLPADATTVLGDSLLASYGGLTLTGTPKVAIRTHPADLSAANSVMDKVQTRLGVTSTFPLAVETSGDDLVLATTTDYAHEVERAGTLGRQTLAALALGDLPHQVAAAGYVDLSKILPLLGSLPRDVQALKAIGFWSAIDGSVQRAQLRVVVG